MLADLLVLAVIAVVAAVVLGKIKLPVVAGLLAAGAFAGPYGLRLVQESENLELFAEIGVVLLLFTIGMEFSADRVARVGKSAALTGVLQIVATMGVVILIALAFEQTIQRAIFFGMAFALSSTAIVLRSLQDRGEIEAPHGRLVLGTLIMQDLAIVPMILAVPLLAGMNGAVVGGQLLLILGKAFVLIAGTWLAARYIIPKILKAVDATRSREVFTLTILCLGLGVAWISLKAGMSLALGAFLAGIMLADSDFAHRAMSEVLPMRDVLTSFFFIVIGMLFDWRVLVAEPAAVLGLFFALLIGKSIIAALGVLLLKFPARVALLTGLGLAQFGEFGYLLLRAGIAEGLIERGEMQIVLCAGLLSMFVTPVIIMLAPHISAGEALLKPLERKLGVRGMDEPESCHECIENHIVIAGFGPAGRMLAGALALSSVPYIVLELNSKTVSDYREKGEPIYYADITSSEALKHAQIENALALVILINDAEAVRRAISIAKRFNPDLNVLVRSRYILNVPVLERIGATKVIVEEMEGANKMLEEVFGMIGKEPEATGVYLQKS